MKFAALAALLLPAALGAAPRIVYNKSFPGSVPAWVGIEIERTGATVYKEAPDDDSPVAFKLSSENADAIFDLVEKLERFKRPLESGLKVANMGMKTFRYEDGAERSEAKFNYSQDENARLLTDWFERMTETQQHQFTLERTARFDKLGVNKTLLQIESAMERGRIVGPERFLPMLDRVAKNESYLHMARERAASLADSIRNPRPKTE